MLTVDILTTYAYQHFDMREKTLILPFFLLLGGCSILETMETYEAKSLGELLYDIHTLRQKGEISEKQYAVVKKEIIKGKISTRGDSFANPSPKDPIRQKLFHMKYQVGRYGPQAENIFIPLKNTHEITKIKGIKFYSKKIRGVQCRQNTIFYGYGAPFEKYFEYAINTELDSAGLLSEQSTKLFYGEINKLNTDSLAGSWEITLTLRSREGTAFTKHIRSDYDTHFLGWRACSQAAEAFRPAVLKLFNEITNDTDFIQMFL